MNTPGHYLSTLSMGARTIINDIYFFTTGRSMTTPPLAYSFSRSFGHVSKRERARARLARSVQTSKDVFTVESGVIDFLAFKLIEDLP
jgi:hypothetical protein